MRDYYLKKPNIDDKYINKLIDSYLQIPYSGETMVRDHSGDLTSDELKTGNLLLSFENVKDMVKYVIGCLIENEGFKVN